MIPFAPIGFWLGKRLGHWLVYIVITAIAGWAAYVTIIKPHIKPIPTTTVESGGVANTYNIKVGLGGCARITPAVKDK